MEMDLEYFNILGHMTKSRDQEISKFSFKFCSNFRKFKEKRIKY